MTPLSSPKRIFITRDPQSLGEIQDALGDAHVGFDGLALIETRELAAEIPPLSDFDTVLFTSVNAVQHFCMRSMVQWSVRKNLPRVVAVGPATLAALSDLGIDARILSSDFSGSAAAQALVESGLSAGQRLLWPCGNLANPVVSQLLSRAEVQLSQLTVYETRVNPEAKDQWAVRMNPLPAAMGFTSPSSVRACLGLLEREPERLNGCLLGAIGPTTAVAMQKSFGRVDVVAEPHTVMSLASTLKRALMASDTPI